MILLAILRNAGIRPARLLSSIRGWKRYVRDRSRFLKLGGTAYFPWAKERPILTEWNETSGGMGAYFIQDLTIARWIRENAPQRHIDVGSRIDGFVANVATFRDIEVLDIRPAQAEVSGIRFHQVDLTKNLPGQWIACADSLSCLHTIEHFGLGRYNDAIDPDGHLKGLKQLKRIVSPGGLLYLSTPIGPQRIEFNAHRVFAARTLIKWFSNDEWRVERFAWIDDNDQLHTLTNWSDPDIENHFSCNLGVGIVMARKKR